MTHLNDASYHEDSGDSASFCQNNFGDSVRLLSRSAILRIENATAILRIYALQMKQILRFYAFLPE